MTRETAAEENATSYFPLLDRIADGAFDDIVTDKELYDRFLQIVRNDGHLTTPEGLASFKLSLAIRSAAPRIQAHYQYYNTSVEPSLMVAQDTVCPVWVHSDGKQYCSSTMERAQQDAGEVDPRELPFDRIFGDLSSPPAVLYADVASPMFKEFHQSLSALAKEGFVSYRVRYRPPQHWSPRPLFVAGYGVELALKRTDYIVIDDRDAEQRDKKDSKADADENSAAQDDSLDDLKPLSSSEVSRLGLNTAGYVMDSKDPLEALLKVTQDFPKYSPRIAAHNTSALLLKEIRFNRANMFPPGFNILWINGAQVDPRRTDAFSLVDQLRRERRLVEKFKDLGLYAKEAVSFLSHRSIGLAQANDALPRYDYRDDTEGGNVIIWLNDLEKDTRYESWPSDLDSYLQRSYPGQLPSVRRDLHNVVFPVDLTNPKDVELVIQTIQIFIKRQIPIRFGIVPTAFSPGSLEQAKIAHYLQEAFGLSSLIQYLQESASRNKIAAPDKSSFKSVAKARDVRAGKESLSFEEILANDELDVIVSRTVDYQTRLGISDGAPNFFANGIALTRVDNWVQDLSQQISKDLHLVQQAIVDGNVEENTWLPGFLISGAFERRNSLIIPENPKETRFVDIAKVFKSRGEILDSIPCLKSGADGVSDSVHVIVVGDFDSEAGFKLLNAALSLKKGHQEAEILFLHNPRTLEFTSLGTSAKLHRSFKEDHELDAAQIMTKLEYSDSAEGSISEAETQEISQSLAVQQSLAQDLGFALGTSGLMVNGRIVGPLPKDPVLTTGDLDQLLNYERTKRTAPVIEALKDLGLDAKFSSPLDLAKITSLAALSMVSDTPEGLFDSPPPIRVNMFNQWNTTHSVITLSKVEDPTISVVAVIDPTSEVAQKWVPVLKILSELAGVNLKILLNPREEIQELPIKRFYRYVLRSEPSFNSDGSILEPKASFTGVPVQALLTLGMDVPSPWLVAPKESVYDLDNIKLSTLKKGANVDAVYALEYILIEGHSRDLTTKSPPRGVQLLLGTEDNPHFSDTIIMANLGYFQFKAQPGIWKINLKPGRSQDIFNLDSVGGFGYTPQPGDENNEVALLSFQGITLFPRLTRKKGYEDEDVLQESGSRLGSAINYVSKGLNFASDVLSGVGINPKSSGAEKHADINIFSVASGHLYERMLNIMMVSVMRNTKHSVKFWFIEQFLSPSFKSFLPHLAKEHGFSYEMVTYKWPHWLRGQREKQREIWGYKILFLDVLFPLSLDKVIFVDADQIVRTDLYDLVTLDLEGAPYGFTPMCDSRTEMEGFRFWKQGYWKNFLRGLPYHISALYVVDLSRFRALAAGDRLRGQYQALSADPGSLSNLDQDLPNHMQHYIPIKSLPQDWLWCETWCSDESLARAKTIDLCNNPLTKEPKLDRARRQVPEWTAYDDEIAALANRVAGGIPTEEPSYSHGEEGQKVLEEPAGWKKDEL
ncbi:hypothetical protein MPDQ_002268 [Monascus purpureus]|uniref:UDP-glucose:glycoprotein glucosyltransferase n=1 Tax=Monascus purpureus TaxID=5098 RepID=A0A507R416_MONPU|nr:hypothetical protein MPDQ_002268 [Monascus purpureus]BDD59984.1 hypothetical protein MAP00_005150 [Monascus purpureus]